MLLICHYFLRTHYEASKLFAWQARRESNPQPAVLETAALPIELLAYLSTKQSHRVNDSVASSKTELYYSIILATTPAPTVRPPSRTAKRKPSSIATGAIISTVTFTLSPGITISTPSGKNTAPVISVVLK